jgi:hypothetical protein
MNDQPVFPSNSSGPFASPPGGSSGLFGGGLNWILIGVLGLGAVVFAALTLVFFNQASAATKTLNDQKAKAASDAKAQQKKDDDLAATKANESPYRSYQSPIAFGAFIINFPKNWSSYVDQEQGGTQVNLVLNPDFVGRTNGTDNLEAARITLQETASDNFMNQFQGLVKNGDMHQNTIQVSGLAAFDLTGKFNDRRTVREVVVPVRDKVIVFINENSQFKNEFGQILAQAKINP